MKSNRIATALILGLAVTVAAQAQNPFTCISYTDGAVPDRVILDFYVDYAGSLPIVEMLTNFPPAIGFIFQDPDGDPNGGPPNADLLGTPGNEALEFDTFITLGSVTADNPADPLPLLIVGGAVDIGGQPMATFDENLLDVTWAPAAGANFPNTDPTGTGIGELMARVTLFTTGPTEGFASITLLLQDAKGSSGAVEFPIIDGFGGACIPEPSSISMLVLGLLAFLRRPV